MRWLFHAIVIRSKWQTNYCRPRSEILGPPWFFVWKLLWAYRHYTASWTAYLFVVARFKIFREVRQTWYVLKSVQVIASMATLMEAGKKFNWELKNFCCDVSSLGSAPLSHVQHFTRLVNFITAPSPWCRLASSATMPPCLHTLLTHLLHLASAQIIYRFHPSQNSCPLLQLFYRTHPAEQI